MDISEGRGAGICGGTASSALAARVESHSGRMMGKVVQFKVGIC